MCWEFRQDSSRSASHFKHTARIIQLYLVEDVGSQVASPFGLLGVACVPVHFIIALNGTSITCPCARCKCRLRSSQRTLLTPLGTEISLGRSVVEAPLLINDLFPFIPEQVAEHFLRHALCREHISIRLNVHPCLASAFRHRVLLRFKGNGIG